MSERRCLYCGEVIPEGQMVCPSCVAGEYLKLREWTGKEYTGDAVLVRITYVLDGGQYGIDPDYAVIGFHFAGGGALD